MMTHRTLMVLLTSALLTGTGSSAALAQDAAPAADSSNPFTDVTGVDDVPADPEAEAAPAMSHAEAKQMFTSLFGAEIDRVSRSAETADDLALSQTLLTAAQSDGQAPALVAVLCRNIASLAANDPQGWPTVKTALDTLRSIDPARLPEVMGEVVDTLQRRYNMSRGEQRDAFAPVLLDAVIALADLHMRQGDADNALIQYRRAYAIAGSIRPEARDVIKPKMNDAIDRQRIARQIDTLKGRLKLNPKDEAAARELILAYVTELDQPAEARKYTFLVNDDELTANIRRAATETEELAENDAFKLGEWYRSLAAASTSGDRTRARLLRHALTAYRHFMNLHTEQDLYATRVALSVKAVEEELARLNVPAPTYASGGAATNTIGARGIWVDLLGKYGLTSPHNDDVVKIDTGVRTQGKASRLVLPVIFDGDYDIEFTFVRRSGQYMAFHIPLSADGSRGVNLIMGYRDDGFAGLSAINGYSLRDEENPTRTTTPVEDGKPYKMLFEVRKTDENIGVRVTLNDNEWVKYTGPPSVFSTRTAADHRFAELYTYKCDVDINAVRARAVTGKLVDASNEAPATVEREKKNDDNPAAAAGMSPKAQQIFDNWPSYTNKQKLQALDLLRNAGAEGRRLIEMLDDHYGL